MNASEEWCVSIFTLTTGIPVDTKYYSLICGSVFGGIWLASTLPRLLIHSVHCYQQNVLICTQNDDCDVLNHIPQKSRYIPLSWNVSDHGFN